ncbi:hypothetical protein HD598_002286 [Neomicrococcus aestuarii]|uniref:THUMP-like domain-containing protein n=1 Tax=Neomicrococcus aestuarii TaxID=556325 RepID=A0A7W8TVJ4_9MICC|nr:SAM-dependent methyltransferase [Neomicrococcus aestuarii]MBB5513599.1 hypothetical protein [Neomicrococcus aestuarii]
MPISDAELLEAVLTPEGFALLESTDPTSANTEDQGIALNLALRKASYSPEVSSGVVHQIRLRHLAKPKLGAFAERMIFTRAGLEQATRLQVAAHHAERFRAAGLRQIADLGCGLGTDAMALAALGMNVTAVELDETTAAAATINLMPFDNARVELGDATAFDLSGFDGVWLDPARRTHAGGNTQRIFDPEAFSPPLSFVERLADAGLPVGVKLGPGIPHGSVPANCEAQWVSVDGDVTEVALWFGALRRADVRRSALVLDDDGAHELHAATDFSGATGVGSPVSPDDISGYIYEPDGAVIRAGLVLDVAESVGGSLLDPHIAYFMAPSLVSTPFARAYRVVAVRPYHVKSLRSWVKASGIGVLDIKKRGLDVSPEELRKVLLAGSGSKKNKTKATLILTRVGDERVAIEVEPV